MFGIITILLFFIEFWENIIYLSAGGLGIVSIGVIVWFLVYFLYRIRKGTEKDQIK